MTFGEMLAGAILVSLAAVPLIEAGKWVLPRLAALHVWWKFRRY